MTSEDIEEHLDDVRVELSIEATSGATAAEMLVEATPVANHPAGQLIINVGTNDVFQGVDPESTLGRIEEMLDLFPDAQCVHLVTLNERMFSLTIEGLPERIDTVNGGIRGLADERERVKIIDWSAIVEESHTEDEGSDLIGRDTIHPTEEGQSRLAEAYSEAIRAC